MLYFGSRKVDLFLGDSSHLTRFIFWSFFHNDYPKVVGSQCILRQAHLLNGVKLIIVIVDWSSNIGRQMICCLIYRWYNTIRQIRLKFGLCTTRWTRCGFLLYGLGLYPMVLECVDKMTLNLRGLLMRPLFMYISFYSIVWGIEKVLGHPTSQNDSQ